MKLGGGRYLPMVMLQLARSSGLTSVSFSIYRKFLLLSDLFYIGNIPNLFLHLRLLEVMNCGVRSTLPHYMLPTPLHCRLNICTPEEHLKIETRERAFFKYLIK